MRSRWLLLPLLGVLALAVAGAVWWFSQRESRARDDAADAAAAAYAMAWQRRDLTGVRFTDPEAPADFTRAHRALGAATVQVRAGGVTRDEDRASCTFAITWTLPGEKTFRYAVPVQLVDTDGQWTVTSMPGRSLWSADLEERGRFRVQRVPSERGDLLDRGGAALMPMSTVHQVLIDPAKATATSVARLEKVVDADPGSLVAKLAAATKARSLAPIYVITYRDSDWTPRQARLRAIAGVLTPTAEQPLARTRRFGQPLFGRFGDVTAETVAKSDGRYVAGERAGLSGLQRQYDGELAGVPTFEVLGREGKVLFRQAGSDGHDVRTTLDMRVQQAAEDALVGAKDVPAAVVALDVPTGEVIAAASSPADGFDRALTGRYVPGSTLKIATAYALLSKRVIGPTSQVTCPKTVAVEGKSFRNYEGEAFGPVTFLKDFAVSCNTAFIRVAPRLGDSDLKDAATALGLGLDWTASVGVDGAYAGSVPANESPVDKAAASIGQGRNEVSPLAMAVLAGTVARGRFVPPVLVHREGMTPPQAPPLDPATVAQVRVLMRGVVTGGTGAALRSVPGGPVFGKTGTAEFGTGPAPDARAWFVGYQGRVAFAVLVEEGRSGALVAVPIARTFLTTLATH